MAARFPSPVTRPLPKAPRDLAEALDGGGIQHGWVRLSSIDWDAFLFLVNGKAHAAGLLQNDELDSIPFSEFFSRAPNSVKVELCDTDPVLVLCLEVLFRKAPSAQIPTTLLNSEELLYAVRESGKDGVMVIRVGDARSLVFCREGIPVVLHAAEGEVFPGTGSVADQVVQYLKGRSGASLDLYEEIRLPQAEGGGRPFGSYVDEPTMPSMPAANTPTIVVRLGERPVFRYPAIKPRITIGRGAQNDIPLDNVSVSRAHAAIVRTGGGWAIEDLGSENGVVLNGRKIARAEMTPGVQVQVGKYVLVLSKYAAADLPPPPKPAASNAPQEETLFVPTKAGATAFLEEAGVKHKLSGLATDIGSGDRAHVKLRGIFVAGVHARVFKQQDGSYTVEHLAGLRKVYVNGKRVKLATLSDGDEIRIAGRVLRFLQPLGTGSTAAKLGPR